MADPRWGYTEVGKRLIERAGDDWWKLALEQALREAGMEESDDYYVRLSVIELPEVLTEAEAIEFYKRITGDVGGVGDPTLVEDVVVGAGSEFTCPDCGYLVDTPNHELGCSTGRAGRLGPDSDAASEPGTPNH